MENTLEENKRLEEQLQTKSTQLQDAGAEISRLSQTAKDFKTKNDILSVDLSESKHKVSRYQQESVASGQKQAQLQEELNQERTGKNVVMQQNDLLKKELETTREHGKKRIKDLETEGESSNHKIRELDTDVKMLEGKVEFLKQERDSLQQKSQKTIGELENKLTNMEKDNDSLRQKLKKNHDKINELEDTNRTLKNRILVLEGKVQELTDDSLKKNFAQLKNVLAQKETENKRLSSELAECEVRMRKYQQESSASLQKSAQLQRELDQEHICKGDMMQKNERLEKELEDTKTQVRKYQEKVSASNEIQQHMATMPQVQFPFKDRALQLQEQVHDLQRKLRQQENSKTNKDIELYEKIKALDAVLLQKENDSSDQAAEMKKLKSELQDVQEKKKSLESELRKEIADIQQSQFQHARTKDESRSLSSLKSENQRLKAETLAI